MKAIARTCVEKYSTARSIKTLRYPVSVNKCNVFSTLPQEDSLRIKKMMNIFLTRSVRNQV